MVWRSGLHVAVDPKIAVGAVGLIMYSNKNDGVQRYLMTSAQGLMYMQGEGVKILRVEDNQVIGEKEVLKGVEGVDIALIPLSDNDQVACYVPSIGPVTGKADDLSCYKQGVPTRRQGCKFLAGKKLYRILNMKPMSKFMVHEHKDSDEANDVLDPIAFTARKSNLYGDGGAAIINPVGQVIGVIYGGVGAGDQKEGSAGKSTGTAYKISDVINAFPGLGLEVCTYTEAFNPCNCRKTPERYLTKGVMDALAHENSCNVTVYWDGTQIPEFPAQDAAVPASVPTPVVTVLGEVPLNHTRVTHISTKPDSEIVTLIDILDSKEMVVDEFCTLSSTEREPPIKVELSESAEGSLRTLSDSGMCGTAWVLACPSADGGAQ